MGKKEKSENCFKVELAINWNLKGWNLLAVGKNTKPIMKKLLFNETPLSLTCTFLDRYP